uniref:Uncharacterized protein n=1 Tax=Lygus hesperus TaxID=30085 RepID=A0A0A9YHD8_LYGHE
MKAKKEAAVDRYAPNPFPLPQIQHEDGLPKPLALPGYEYDWARHVPPFERLYHHHTLSSIRQYHLLRQSCAPKDSLDIMLTSVYDHTKECFYPKAWPYVQPETVGLPTFRLLRNVRYFPAKRAARDLKKDDTKYAESCSGAPGTKWHGIKQGGIKERKDVNSVKLGIIGSHGSQSNRGYSRKVDGTFFSQ